jgi:copper chaperone
VATFTQYPWGVYVLCHPMSNAYPHPVSSENEMIIAGMTCSHCVMSVTEEVSAVPGVAAVDVDLATGRLTVTGEGYSEEAIKAAVAEAGYEVIA